MSEIPPMPSLISMESFLNLAALLQKIACSLQMQLVSKYARNTDVLFRKEQMDHVAHVAIMQ